MSRFARHGFSEAVHPPPPGAAVADLMGRKKITLSHAESYSIPLQPQEIVTLHFDVNQTLSAPDPITSWEEFVPQQKRAALRAYNPNLKGHPPFGGGSLTF